VKFEEMWIAPGYRKPDLDFRIDEMKALLAERGVT